MSDLNIVQYRQLHKNSKGYHYSWDVAKQACPDEHPEPVAVLIIDGEYYPLPEPLRIWSKWQDEQYD